jgi:peroxiredoxin
METAFMLVHRSRVALGVAALTVFSAGSALIAEEGAKPAPKQEYVTPETPGLEVGAKAPEVMVTNADGEEMALSSMWKDKPVIVTFYRGGWCPFCTKALSAWQGRMDDVDAAGAEFVAITPEKVEFIAKTKEKHELGYTVVSDASGDAQRAFNLQFTLDDETIKKYKGYGIDLGKQNADGTWTLPAPATMVIDTEGVIRWIEADWDYKERADPDDVLDAVRALGT